MNPEYERETTMPASSLAALREQLSQQGLATTVKPNAGQGALPDGVYVFKVTHYQQTVSGEQSANAGCLLYKVGLKVVKDDYKGSTAWLNNSVTEERFVPAMGLMTGFWTACGVPQSEIDDPEFDPDDDWGKRNVINRVIKGEVTFSPAKGDFRESNFFKKFTPYEMTTEDLLGD